MTDTEIIKALKECTKHTECEACHFMDECYDLDVLHRNALYLINRQKAEIEEKSKRLSEILPIVAEISTEAAKKSAEAVKEFAEKVQIEIKKALENNYKARAEKEKEEFNKYLDNLFWNYCTGKIDCLRGINDFVDNLLKEMVGDADGKRKEEIP